MDLRPLEAIMAEVGKAFRLCRFYPSTHPSVQQALSELSASLPDLSPLGTVELKISPNGFLMGSAALGARNPPLVELAGLLYAQGYRALTLEPGLTSDEVAALIRMASGAGGKAMQAMGAHTHMKALPHLHLEQAARKYSKQAPPAAGAQPVSEGPAMGRRSTGVFRPDALPPEIEAARLMTLLEHSAEGEAPRMISRLAELGSDLVAQNDYGLLAKIVVALMAQLGRGAAVAEAARAAMEKCVSDIAIGGLVSRLGDSRVSAGDRDVVVQALGGLKGRSIPLLVDAFVSAMTPEERDVLAGVARCAGDAAVLPIEARSTSDDRPLAALAHATLLAATRSARAAPLLGKLAHHADASVRAAAVSGLARLDVPDASRLVTGALRDGDPAVRAAAARGVTWFGDHTVGGIVLARLNEEQEETVAVYLIEALGALREMRAVGPLSDLARGVSGVFQRHPVAVRAAAIRALGALGTPEARAVVESHKGDRLSELREAALDALRAAGSPGD